MQSQSTRRDFVKKSAAVSAGIALASSKAIADHHEGKFKISLAEWSLNRPLFAGKIDNRDFAKVAKRECGIDAIEYVNQFFKDKANDKNYLGELKTRAEGEGVKTLLIMIDGEGKLGDPSLLARAKAVENHYKWVEAAKFLGCHSIRVNAASAGSYEDQVHRAADGLRALTEFGAKHDINVIVENHGGLSSNGAWLAEVITKVDHERCGTLPDFGNFNVGGGQLYNRYKGVMELMPFAKAVSAKSHEFNDKGDEVRTDYLRMMKIVLDAGYHGYVGIEFEGAGSPFEGIKLTKNLLERVRDELS